MQSMQPMFFLDDTQVLTQMLFLLPSMSQIHRRLLLIDLIIQE